MPDGVCRRRVDRNNDKNDIDLNPILEDEKLIMNVNNNEATIAGTHVIKNKTIYQLSNSEFVSDHKKDKNVTTDNKAQSIPEILKLSDIKHKSNKTRNCKNDKRKVSTKNKSNLFESSAKDSSGIISWNIHGLKGHKASLFKHRCNDSDIENLLLQNDIISSYVKPGEINVIQIY